MPYPIREFDPEEYNRRSQTGPCFICAIVAEDPDYTHHMVYEDDHAVAFLDRMPTLVGYTLVAPRAHVEHVTGDFTPAAYLDLQRVVHRIGEAVRAEFDPERLYLLSLGSQHGNSHVHWHIAPLPGGVPYEQQQLAALHKNGRVLDIPEADLADLAARLRHRVG